MTYKPLSDYGGSLMDGCEINSDLPHNAGVTIRKLSELEAAGDMYTPVCVVLV